MCTYVRTGTFITPGSNQSAKTKTAEMTSLHNFCLSLKSFKVTGIEWNSNNLEWQLSLTTSISSAKFQLLAAGDHRLGLGGTVASSLLLVLPVDCFPKKFHQLKSCRLLWANLFRSESRSRALYIQTELQCNCCDDPWVERSRCTFLRGASTHIRHRWVDAGTLLWNALYCKSCNISCLLHLFTLIKLTSVTSYILLCIIMQVKCGEMTLDDLYGLEPIDTGSDLSTEIPKGNYSHRTSIWCNEWFY